MDKNTYILTIDFGTQSVRVGIFSKEGKALAIEKKEYNPPYFSTLPNYAEKNAYEYYHDLCDATQILCKNNPDLIKNVKGITLTCFRDSAVLLDKNYQIIRPTILWLDQRMAKCKKKLPLIHRILFRIVGMSNAINFNRRRTISNWIKENEPENWAKVYKYVSLSTYFTYLLTGNLVDSASNYAGHYPLNYKKRQWYKNPTKHLKGQVFGIEKRMLCDLIKEGETLGTINKKASLDTGLPVGLKMIACGSDKSCETLGLGVIDSTTGAISYGTASTIETTVSRYVESETFLPGYVSCIPNYFNMDIQIYRGYWMINWFLKEFGGKKVDDIVISNVSADDFNEKLPQISPGCDGLVLQPYWGPGLSRPLAKGAIIGFSDAITQEHFYRAIIEGIAYALREGLEHFEFKLHHKINKIRISGGGSTSDQICQITADILGKEVSRVQTSETSSLGAAISGFLALGVYKSPQEAVNNMVHQTKTFYPQKEIQAQYNYLYKNVYRKMYPQLKGIYKSIKDFNYEKEEKFYKKNKK